MKIQDLSKNLLTKALWDILKLGLGILFVASSTMFTSTLLADTIQSLEEYRYYLMTIITSIGLLLFILIYQKFNKNKPAFPNLEFDYRVVEKELSIDFSDRNTMLYKKRNFLRALRKNLNAYHDKYHWTGSGTVNISSTIRGQKFQKTRKKNIFQHYEILFQHSLKKGDTVETELLWDLSDTDMKMVPFISATIEEPTDLLIMTVAFHDNMNIDEIICEVSSSIGESKPFDVEKRKLDRSGKATWRIRNPTLLFHYEMSWLF